MPCPHGDHGCAVSTRDAKEEIYLYQALNSCVDSVVWFTLFSCTLLTYRYVEARDVEASRMCPNRSGNHHSYCKVMNESPLQHLARRQHSKLRSVLGHAAAQPAPAPCAKSPAPTRRVAVAAAPAPARTSSAGAGKSLVGRPFCAESCYKVD